MADETGGPGGPDDGSRDSGSTGVSGPDEARESVREATRTAERSEAARDGLSNAGGVLGDVADQVGGGPGPGAGSLDAAQASAQGASRPSGRDSPGPGEGSMDAAQAAAQNRSARDDRENERDRDRPGPGEGSLDAAQAAGQSASRGSQPGSGEGSLDAAQASAQRSREDRGDRDDNDRPGRGDGSLDAAQAHGQALAGEARAAQERLEAEGRIARDVFDRRAQAIEFGAALAEREFNRRAQDTARALIAENTLQTLQGGPMMGEMVEQLSPAGLANDLVALSRTDPRLAEAVYAQTLLEAPSAAAVEQAVDRLLDQERRATAGLLGETAYAPSDPAQVEARAERLLDAHRTTERFTGRPDVDLESLSYEIGQIALEDPSLAVDLRNAVARELSPTDAANLNRQLSGGRTFDERLELSFENPSVIPGGFVRGTGNLVTGGAELVLDLANLADIGTNNLLGYGLQAIGADEWAQRRFDAADHYGEVMAERDWSIPYENDAQRGIGDAVGVAEFVTGLAGFARSGLGRVTRNVADEVLEDVPPPGGDILDDLVPPNQVASPGGVTPGRDYSPEAIQRFSFGQLLRERIGGPPEGMFDPHAHHVIFKRGNGAAQQELVDEAQQILRDYDIDPIYGPEVLGWAPNRVPGQHSIDALRPVVDRLRTEAELGAAREDIVRALNEFKEIAARRGQ